jgi:hypothetical protein
MVVPDMEQICEIMLFSEGFDSAKVCVGVWGWPWPEGARRLRVSPPPFTHPS